MVRPGSTLTNPLTGESLQFVETAATTNGALLKLWASIAPGSSGGSLHVHPKSEERVTVLKGELLFTLNGEQVSHTAGENVMIPAGVAHTWHNVGAAPVEVYLEYTPPLMLETYFETVMALSQKGITKMSLLQRALLLDTCKDVLYDAGKPVWMQKLVFGILAEIGKIRGLQATCACVPDTLRTVTQQMYAVRM
jgi:mannose-6-phosphate isomerase-like protein (cupin superfamily)